MHEMSEGLCAGIPGAGHALIDGAGHAPSMEQPEGLNRVVYERAGMHIVKRQDIYEKALSIENEASAPS